MSYQDVPRPTVIRRRLPDLIELAKLIKLRPGKGNVTQRRLSQAHTIADLRDQARRRVPRAVFDFVDGGAEDEITVQRTRAAFSRIEFQPKVLAGLGTVDTSTSLFGCRMDLPLALAPTGFSRICHYQGERAAARAAALSGVPFTLTTMATVSIEDVAAVGGPAAVQWFQLYVMRDRGLTLELVQRAKAAGYNALVITVDTPVTGQRRKDLRSGFTVPPQITADTILDIMRRPIWLFNLLTTEPLVFATIPAGDPTAHAKFIDSVFDPNVAFSDIKPVRDAWDGPIILKGIQTLEDAKLALEHGADGIVVSSHGGRQLDRTPVPLEILPAVADKLGDRLSILLDSGVRTGADLAAALALGARACLVGRPYLYGLMAAGEEGVAKAINIYKSELKRTMHLLGVSKISDFSPKYAVLRPQ